VANATTARTNISAAKSGANSDITSLTGLTTPLSQAQGGTGTTTGYYGFKNRIINGAMVIDQRNAGASTTAADNVYTLDRWQTGSSASSKFTIQQNAGSVTPPAGFSNYLGCTSSSAYTVGAGETFNVAQQIEGYNVADLAWGTANAKTVTLSFWVRSSLTGTFGGALANSNVTRSYPFSYTISAANTWEQKTITIAGDTSGTWQTTTSTGIRVWMSIGTGSTLSGTAGAWAGSDFRSATGATSVVGTNGATFYITGVQLEVGSTATSFDYRQYQQELANCQRYAQVVEQNNFGIILSSASSGTTWAWWPLKTTMRSAPSLTLQNSGAWSGTTPTIYAQPNQVGFYGSTTNFTLGGGSAGSVIAVLSSEL
jgi:hypothetical protein